MDKWLSIVYFNVTCVKWLKVLFYCRSMLSTSSGLCTGTLTLGKTSFPSSQMECKQLYWALPLQFGRYVVTFMLLFVSDFWIDWHGCRPCQLMSVFQWSTSVHQVLLVVAFTVLRHSALIWKWCLLFSLPYILSNYYAVYFLYWAAVDFP